MVIICHTPDADDAFMFYALRKRIIDNDFEFCVDDIETLNRMVIRGEAEVSSSSVNAYFKAMKNYSMLRAGGSFGEGYGPVIVSERDFSRDEIGKLSIAVPGKLTSSYLIYRLFFRADSEVEMRFDRIIDAVLNDDVDLGLLIHEGQDTYRNYGLRLFSDLYNEWKNITDYPLPLGIMVIRKDLGKRNYIQRMIRDSIDYSLKHVDDAIDFAMEYSRGNDRDTIKKFALKYVNERTYDMGKDGLGAIKFLYRAAREMNLI
ncbi:MAG: menaquinone biosynthesis family protein [Thermoplasmata archaeon]